MKLTCRLMSLEDVDLTCGSVRKYTTARRIDEPVAVD